MSECSYIKKSFINIHISPLRNEVFNFKRHSGDNKDILGCITDSIKS